MGGRGALEILESRIKSPFSDSKVIPDSKFILANIVENRRKKLTRTPYEFS